MTVRGFMSFLTSVKSYSENKRVKTKDYMQYSEAAFRVRQEKKCLTEEN